jgi:antitoxin component of MazEF toxin-antitoxin module
MGTDPIGRALSIHGSVYRAFEISAFQLGGSINLILHWIYNGQPRITTDYYGTTMTKTLTKHGNSYALVIDRAIMELLKITPETELEISTDGTVLTITPASASPRRGKVKSALERVNARHSKTLRRLAQ